jgi:hypothetical protein
MPQLKPFDAGDIGLRPTETGVEARAATARRIGTFYNQQAGATETLARETDRLGRETEKLGGETRGLGRETERLGSETKGLGRETQRLGSETGKLGSETQQLGRETGQLGDFKGHLLTATGRQFGSAIEAAGNEAVRYLDHQQIIQGQVAYSNMLAAKTAEWNNTVKNADPNDPTVAQRFMAQSVEPELQRFSETGFYTEKGQQWATAHVDALRKHFTEKTTADMSTMAGHAAVVNQRQTVNSLSNTVRSDPSSLDFSLAAMESGTEGVLASSPNLNAHDAARARSEILQRGKESIIKSAALGYIEKTGTVPPWVSDPKYAPYVDGAELKQLAQAAKYYQRLNESENRAARVQRDYDLKNDFHVKVNALEASTMPQNAGDPPRLPDNYWSTMRELATHPGAALEPGRLAQMVRNGEILTDKLNKPEPLARVSHNTTMDLLNRMRATDETRLTDNTAIYEAYGAGKLSRADFTFLNGEFASARTPQGARLEKDRGEFFKRFAASVDGAMDFGGHSALGSQRMYAFEMEARRQEEDLRKQGKDPHQIYDPSSPNFIGKLVPKYHVSMSEAQGFEKQIQAEKKSINLTAPGTTITGVETVNAPPIPPPEKRVIGKTYELPKGKAKWNGRAWETP